MKKHYLITLFLVFILSFLSVKAYALYSGEYMVTYHSSLTIPGYRFTPGLNYGTLTLNTDNSFNLYDDDNGTDRYFNGTFTIIHKNTQVLFNPDADVTSELQDSIAAWLERSAINSGVSISDIIFAPNCKLSVSKASIQKRTGYIKNIVVKYSGRISATVNGIPKTKAFHYQSTLKLNP
ncbi:MAG: hypothetical protein ACLQDI_25415 [Syntrophobacteraceae bacterium]